MSPLRRFLLPLLILAVPGFAAEKRAFQIEDLYRLKGVQHLALSPDGSRLAFEVSSQDLKAAKRDTQLWVLETATGAAKAAHLFRQGRHLPPVVEGRQDAVLPIQS